MLIKRFYEMKKDLSNNYTIMSPLKEDVSIIVPDLDFL